MPHLRTILSNHYLPLPAAVTAAPLVATATAIANPADKSSSGSSSFLIAGSMAVSGHQNSSILAASAGIVNVSISGGGVGASSGHIANNVNVQTLSELKVRALKT